MSKIYWSIIRLFFLGIGSGPPITTTGAIRSLRYYSRHVHAELETAIGRRRLPSYQLRCREDGQFWSMGEDIVVRSQLPLQCDGSRAQQEVHVQGARREPVWRLGSAHHGRLYHCQGNLNAYVTI